MSRHRTWQISGQAVRDWRPSLVVCCVRLRGVVEYVWLDPRETGFGGLEPGDCVFGVLDIVAL
jgi:hypothetical protein